MEKEQILEEINKAIRELDLSSESYTREWEAISILANVCKEIVEKLP